MSRFTDEVKVVNRLSGRVHQWELCQEVVYYLRRPDGEFVHVPIGFATDFASVPRPFWWWIAPWGRHGRAAIIHDFLYQKGAVTGPEGGLRRPGRWEADRVFRQAMAVLDREILTKSRFWRRFPGFVVALRLAVAAPRRWLMWAAVVLFGCLAYDRQQDKGTAPRLEHDMLVRVEQLMEAERTAPGADGVSPGGHI